MKPIPLILFLILFNTAKSQNPMSQIYGDWITYKMEMADGSPYKNGRAFTGSNGMVTITRNSIQLSSLETRSGYPAPYEISGNNLITSKWAGYTIEKVTKDSMVLSENFKDAKKKDLIRYFLINNRKHIADLQARYTGKDTLYATADFSPRLNNKFREQLPKSVISINDFLLSGTIRLNLLDHTASFHIPDYESKSRTEKKYADQVIKAFEDNYASWDLSDVSQFKIIDIPIFVYGKKIGTFTTLSIALYKKNKYPIISAQYFDTALKAYNDGDLDTAAFYFGKSYDEDSDSVDALLNKAAINFERNKKAEACADWKILSDMGNQQAAELLNANCQ